MFAGSLNAEIRSILEIICNVPNLPSSLGFSFIISVHLTLMKQQFNSQTVVFNSLRISLFEPTSATQVKEDDASNTSSSGRLFS